MSGSRNSNNQSGITLTDLTQLGRQAIKVVAVFFVVMIVGRFAVQSFTAFWRAMNPPAPPPPTVGFGILPSVRFPEQSLETRLSEYSLELPRSDFPQFSDRAKVFFMPLSSLSLLSDQNAREFAALYGFVFEPTILSPRLYRWQRSTPLESTLELDIQTYQMRLTTNYLNRPDLLVSSRVPDVATAEQTVKNFLNTGGLVDSSVATNSAETRYLRLQGTQLTEAVSFSDADFIEVNLNRFPVDGMYDFFTPDGNAIVKAVVAGGLSGINAVVDFTSNFKPIDTTQMHTYPIRTPSQAWSILQAGEGYVARYTGSSQTAIIRGVQLGYYDDYEEQQYMQPIYVFYGDDDFLGYVPAVDPRFVQPINQ